MTNPKRENCHAEGPPHQSWSSQANDAGCRTGSTYNNVGEVIAVTPWWCQTLAGAVGSSIKGMTSLALSAPIKETRRRLARERKRCFSSSSEDGSRKRESVNSWWILYELWRGKLWNNTDTLLHTNTFTDAFTHRDFYTQRLLHTDTFTRRRFYTQALLHADTCTHKHFHRHVYTQRLLHTEAFTHRGFYTDTFTRRRFYTQALLHADAFTHRSFYTQTLLHTNAFAHRPFYTQTLLHTEAFTHRRFYTQMFLHTHTHFHTQRLLHTEAFEECLYMTFYGPELKLFCFWHQTHDGIELCCKRLQTFH